MDILTHAVTGLAVGAIVANLLPEVKTITQRLLTIAAGVVGGVFPDIDAISLWSGFDAHFGRFFAHSGKEIYAGKFWYSHHGFFHSIAAVALLTAIVGGLTFPVWRFIRRKRAFAKSFANFRSRFRSIVVALVLADVMHLFFDMLTPASVWGGVRMFWPFSVYVGGWGKVWWWNNYDIFLIVAIVAGVNILWFVFYVLHKNLNNSIPLITAVVAVVLIAIQAENRKTDYAYKGNTTNYQYFEKASKREQQRILGVSIYNVMKKFDEKLPFYF